MVRRIASSPDAEKLVLSAFPIHGTLANHERIRRRVHRFSRTAAFLPNNSWMRHPHQDERSVACIPKGFHTMFATQDRFSDQIRNRLETVGMGLGLVRLLLDAGQTKEARTTLNLLENGSQGVAESNKPNGKPCKARRLKRVTSSAFRAAKRLIRPSSAA
jgi:hypothetical protein